MGKVEEKKKQKKDTLFSAAFELFTSQGLNKTTISEIAEKAGVAKGTFYLYFKDKYDLRNKLIAQQASLLFTQAHEPLLKENIEDLEEQIIFLVSHIMDQLAQKKQILNFISKNLSWGVFKTALLSKNNHYDVDFLEVYHELLKRSERPCNEPEIMLFLIIEFVGSSCHDAILYQEPAPIETLKPYILTVVRNIIRTHVAAST